MRQVFKMGLLVSLLAIGCTSTPGPQPFTINVPPVPAGLTEADVQQMILGELQQFYGWLVATNQLLAIPSFPGPKQEDNASEPIPPEAELREQLEEAIEDPAQLRSGPKL